GRATHAEGIFPVLRVFTNVVVRELQTMAIVLDVNLGVPVIYSTFMQYDELGHHFGSSSRQALADLKRTDARIREIWRAIRGTSSRPYDLVILSDHGMTPAVSYRVRFGESLGTTVRKILDGYRPDGREPLAVHESRGEDTEYADMGPAALESVARSSYGRRHNRLGRALHRLRDWMRSRYGLREIIFPEKYRVDERHQVVVTYSSCLALVYFADVESQIGRREIAADRRRAHLYAELLRHPGIGLLATRDAATVVLESRSGRARIEGDCVQVVSGQNPLAPYGQERYVVRAVRDLVQQPNAGDIVIFGNYDEYEIVSFDDQVGAHGSAGGDQMYPFLITPPELQVSEARIEDARDIHRVVLSRYAEQPNVT
ncbi:MAG TPA: alkaline phosphatase family protein, partial [Gemmatimonadaceae bacterium]|nr:alkaline phosphatase family protein [Gemmatimonadaceae bacterium]